MFTPSVLLNTRFSVADLKVESCNRAWTAPAAYEALVEREWQALLAARPSLWDGIYDRVLDPAELASGFMRLGTVRYRYIAAYPALHAHHVRLGLEPLSHLSTIALIELRGGAYLFGRRARNQAVELIGGGVQRDQLAVESGGDLERNLLKEMREEVGLRAEDIEAAAGIGIVSASNSNVLVVAHVRCRLRQAEVWQRFGERTEDEMAEPVFVPAAELHGLLGAMDDYRPLIAPLLNNA